jgi:hypothetical protein
MERFVKDVAAPIVTTFRNRVDAHRASWLIYSHCQYSVIVKMEFIDKIAAL